jgi:RNA polymerase sigma-70 factor, ECF subfamily
MSEPTPSLGEDTGSSLLAKVKQQDADAWLRLVIWMGPFVLRWCRGFHLQAADCDEVSSQVIEKVWLNLASFRKEAPGDSFRKWVHAITRNTVLDLFRQRKRGQAALDHLADRGSPRGAEDDSAEARDWKRGALLLLIDNIKAQYAQDRGFQAFYRTTVDGRSAPEIALELGLSNDAVRQHKVRWLKRLREQLNQQFAELLD